MPRVRREEDAKGASTVTSLSRKPGPLYDLPELDTRGQRESGTGLQSRMPAQLV
jgi:hypothetical protein